MNDDPIYLDHNATTPLLPEVVDGMLPYLREHFGNPSSSHVYGARARAAVARAREHVAALIGAEPDEIVFTSGGTEANNLAIHGVVRAIDGRRRVVTTAVEHPATARPCDWLERHGFRIVSMHRQFVLPIALHKAVGSPAFTRASEQVLARLGLLRILGSPVTVYAERA